MFSDLSHQSVDKLSLFLSMSSNNSEDNAAHQVLEKEKCFSLDYPTIFARVSDRIKSGDFTNPKLLYRMKKPNNLSLVVYDCFIIRTWHWDGICCMYHEH